MSMVPKITKYFTDVHLPWKYQKKSLEPMDLLHPLRVPPIYGVPLGGIGCGTIGRCYKGSFRRSGLVPGRYCYEIGAADQFILTVKKKGNVVYHQVLSCYTQNVEGLKSWKWSLPTEYGEYIGLYPRSWTVYNFPELKLALVCKQVSPVIPGNYKDSCLPCGVFQWTALNFDTENEVEVSITMTWRGARAPKRPDPPNSGKAGAVCAEIGHMRSNRDDEFTFPFDDADNKLSGCLLETMIDDIPCCFGIAAKTTQKVEVSRCLGFSFGVKNVSDLNQKNTGEELCKSPWGVSAHPMASINDASTAAKMWTDLGQNGHLSSDNTGYYVEGRSKGQPLIGVATCASLKIGKASSNSNPCEENCEFYLVWNMPRVHFRTAIVAYKRRYTRWFTEDTVLGACELLTYASKNVNSWNEAIDSWQDPILQDSGLPAWYKSAIFNELYYVADGGTVWLDPLPVDQSPSSAADTSNSTAATTAASNGVLNPDDEFLSPLDDVRRRNPTVVLRRPADYPISADVDGNVEMDVGVEDNANAIQSRIKLGKEMGIFGYLEGHEYRMYNTYDVHFNASWALLKLWPKLQLSMNYDLADITASEDRQPMKVIFNGANDKKRVTNLFLSVPHDAGNPEAEPFYSVNAYNLRATDEWKDLNSKFVLMVWRDWKITNDDDYFFYMLPLVLAIMQTSLEKWDKDDDGLIENASFPDQTYDTWKAIGLSAYTGGIWLAALYATKDMTTYALGQSRDFETLVTFTKLEQKYEEVLEKAKKNYYDKLWNECCFRYDIRDNKANPIIMADQMCGHWLLRSCGAPMDAILPENTIQIVIDTIIRSNWQSVGEGEMGAINGIRKNGKAITDNLQSDEFWVGPNYCLASLFMLEGMPINGFDLCKAIYKTVVENMGLQYQTPEAYTLGKSYRSPGYMRPLAIWSVQHAIEMRKSRYNGSSQGLRN
nr:non lysosomal glucosylceramidase [Hymenolepis microstoma]